MSGVGSSPALATCETSRSACGCASVIMKTCPCNVYPLEPHFYIAKLGNAVVYIVNIFLIFAPKHRLWVLVRTASQCISERMQNRRLRNGQTFTGARAFSRQKCFVQFFIQNCTLRMYCYIGLACPSTIFQNTIISGMEAL